MIVNYDRAVITIVNYDRKTFSTGHWKFLTRANVTNRVKHNSLLLLCKIFEHFPLQVDSVIEFIQLGSTPFKDSAILAPILADPPFWCKSYSTPSKSGSGLPDPDHLIFCTI